MMAAGLHPATWLLLWAGFAALLQSLAVSILAWVALAMLPLALGLAGRRTRLLLRRARWLFLSIAILFVLATPGERLPGPLGDIGATHDGLTLAAEHVLRLMLLLGSLALLHEHLGTEGLMAGLYWLLAPLAGLRRLREKTVVRLMLVLDHAEKPVVSDWRSWLCANGEAGPSVIALTVRRTHAADWMLLGLLGIVAVLVGMYR
jgi:hypothetical protein